MSKILNLKNNLPNPQYNLWLISRFQKVPYDKELEQISQQIITVLKHLTLISNL